MKVFVSFCFFLTLATLLNAQMPIINTIPSDPTLRIGENFTILCDSQIDLFGVRLDINGEDATNNAAVVDTTPQQTGNKTFVYTTVTADDQGLNFTCFGIISFLSSSGVLLSVLHGPTISNLTNGTGYEGESATITFNVDSNPPVSLTDISIMPVRESVVYVIGSMVTVTFENLQRNDSNSYTVTVVNTEIDSTESVPSSIDVFYNPAFVSSQDISVTVGTSVTIDCSIEPNPAVVSILLNGPGIIMDKALELSNPVYPIGSVTEDDNGNMYNCTASNGPGRSTSQIYTLFVSANPSPSSTVASASSTTTAGLSVTPTSSPNSGSERQVAVVAVVVISIILGLLVNY